MIIAFYLMLKVAASSAWFADSSVAVLQTTAYEVLCESVLRLKGGSGCMHVSRLGCLDRFFFLACSSRH